MVAYAFLVIDDGISCTYKEAVQSVENVYKKRKWMKR
jgi:hypothetical protein